LIGPPQLGRFMQGLFLSDPEEIERRIRVFLPVPHVLQLTAAAAEEATSSSVQARPGLASNGTNGTNGPPAPHTNGSDGKNGSGANGKTNGANGSHGKNGHTTNGNGSSPFHRAVSNGGFDDRTPLLGMSRAGDGSDGSIALSVLASQVVYIAPDEDWE